MRVPSIEYKLFVHNHVKRKKWCAMALQCFWNSIGDGLASKTQLFLVYRNLYSADLFSPLCQSLRRSWYSFGGSQPWDWLNLFYECTIPFSQVIFTCHDDNQSWSSTIVVYVFWARYMVHRCENPPMRLVMILFGLLLFVNHVNI